MHLHVSLAADGRREQFAAVGTFERPHRAVDHHVTRERAVRREGRLTDVTAEVLHARVGLGVGLEHAHRHKEPIALATLVRLLPCHTQRLRMLTVHKN